MAEQSQNKKKQPQSLSERPIEQLGEQTMLCLYALLRDQPEALALESAVFLEQMQVLWSVCHVPPYRVWHELEERLALSEILLARGIRARKGGRYRSTKLP